MKIVCKTEELCFQVELNSSLAAQEILSRLPIESIVSRWGDEIYFETNISAPADGQAMDVKIGDVAYWPEGKCFCVFFGRTEASTTDKPMPASPVVIIGYTMANPSELREIKAGSAIQVFRDNAASGSFVQGQVYDDSRKLTQQEIDMLVKQLLAGRTTAK